MQTTSNPSLPSLLSLVFADATPVFLHLFALPGIR